MKKLLICTSTCLSLLMSGCSTGAELPTCDTQEVQKGAISAIEDGIVSSGGNPGMVSGLKNHVKSLVEYTGSEADAMKSNMQRSLKIKSANGIRICRKEWSPGTFLVVVIAKNPSDQSEIGYVAMNFGLPGAVGSSGWIK